MRLTRMNWNVICSEIFAMRLNDCSYKFNLIDLIKSNASNNGLCTVGIAVFKSSSGFAYKSFSQCENKPGCVQTKKSLDLIRLCFA